MQDFLTMLGSNGVVSISTALFAFVLAGNTYQVLQHRKDIEELKREVEEVRKEYVTALTNISRDLAACLS